MSEWLTQFRRNLEVDDAEPQIQSQSELQLPAETRKKNNVALISSVLVATLLIIMGVATYKIWLRKSAAAAAANNRGVNVKVEGQSPYYPQVDVYRPDPLVMERNIASVEGNVGELQQRHDALETRVQVAFDRLQLLGSLQNQNTVVFEKGHSRNDLVYLNGDWSISELPNRLSNSESLQRFVR